jgi:hypothetical protein
VSTLQHISQQALRTHARGRLALAAMVMLAAAAAVTIALMVSGGSSSDSIQIGGPGTGVTHGTPQHELQAVSGARYGTTRYEQPGQSGPDRNPRGVR